MNLDLSIDIENIQGSFDRIAKDILRKSAVQINSDVYQITEIEFYFYHPEHKDEYTHKHERDEGEWRFHNAGVDITLQVTDDQDGGILIRAVKFNSDDNVNYILGPRKVLGAWFASFGKVTSESKIKLVSIIELDIEIIRTFRHLPNKIVCEEFHDKKYRYLVDIDVYPNALKEKIKADFEIVV